MTDSTDRIRDLEAWLAPFLAVMGRKTRRTWAPLYLRGLLGPGERKSLQPMAMRLGLSGHDQLQHFIASPAWDDEPLWTELAREADRLVGGGKASLVIDDTALPKKGTLSVGVARQYCGQLGKKANCQSLVSLTLAQGEVPLLVGLRLFRPDEWVADPERCARAGVPETMRTAHSKGEIALAERDRLRESGVRFRTILADAGYGTSAAFRHGLDARGLRWAVGIVKNQKVYDAHVQLVPPAGRARKPVPDAEPRPVEKVLAALAWRRVTWRQGPKGALRARFAAVRVRVGDGPVWGNNRHLPGEEVWLVGEWRSSIGIYPERRCGWWASGAPQASASTISPTCRPAHHCARWWARSRHVGSASRRISSSRRNLVSATSRGVPGQGCTGTP
jgi:SRSO17 transposase